MTLDFVDQLISGFTHFVLWYVVIMGGLGVLQMVFALFVSSAHIAKERSYEYRLLGSSEHIIPVSLLATVYNEESNIVDTIKAIRNLNYINYELIVINDGSTDNTLETIINTFNLHKIIYPLRERIQTKEIRGIYCNPDMPHFKLIDKEHGGKSDSLNAGLNLSRYPYFVSLNAGAILEPDALLRVAMAFIQNKYTVAAVGAVRVANGCHIEDGKILATGLPKKAGILFQAIENFRYYLVERISWSALNSLLIISGTFQAFQKEAVLAAGAYTTGTVGGDTDMVLKLHRYMRSKKFRYRVCFLPEPICWTHVSIGFKSFKDRILRRQKGLMDALGRFKGMFLNPRYGIPGLFAMPGHFLRGMLSPFIELAAYIVIPLAWYFGHISTDSLVLFLIAAIGFGIITSLGSVIAEIFCNSKYLRERDVIKLSFISIADNLFYRQLTLLFRLIGIFSYRKSNGKKRRQQKTNSGNNVGN